jgi:hypothetical protein
VQSDQRRTNVVVDAVDRDRARHVGTVVIGVDNAESVRMAAEQDR